VPLVLEKREDRVVRQVHLVQFQIPEALFAVDERAERHHRIEVSAQDQLLGFQQSCTAADSVETSARKADAFSVDHSEVRKYLAPQFVG